ncbi:MAG TPA: sigma-70 family RNA polymerase sigma factor [Symbiobacteriaceae bacterium]|jgi:RNA polymerase sigma-70 factor (ECF subfamily)
MATEAAAVPNIAVDVSDKVLTLERLVDAYGDGILQLAYLQVKDRDLAEDIFQEVFTRVYLNLHKFRGDSSPRTWMYRITINLCRDRLRSPALRRVLLLGEDFLGVSPEPDDVEDTALAAADKAVLLAAVTDLPPEYREVVLLYYYEEMDTREVAETLALSEGTVRSRLHRARAKLRTALSEGGFGHDR